MSEKAKLISKTSEAKKVNSSSKTQKPDFSQPINSPFDYIIFLQRTIGNQTVERLFKSGALQAKLKIGQPNDIYEQEANRVAEQVMRMPEPKLQQKCTTPECEEEKIRPMSISPLQLSSLVQRQEEIKEEEEEVIQMKQVDTKEGNEIDEALILQSKGSGQPLDRGTREFMEPRFGYDFSNVRIHTDSNAAKLTAQLGAEAFTAGKDVFFGRGRYNLASTQGKRLIGHELTHVVQQENELSKKIQKTNGESYSTVEIEGVTLYTSYLTHGEVIVGEARSRMNNPIIRRAYSSEIPWFFTRNSGLAGFTTEN